MTYLITGGTGFIGSYVAKLLLSEGEEVVTYDTIVDQSAIQSRLNKDQLKKVTMVKGDVTDLALLIKTAQKYGAEQIIHLAYLLTSGGEENPSEALRVGIQGTINVFEAAHILNLQKVVWASSVAVFGYRSKYPEIVSNDAPHYPSSIYGLGKSACEYLANHYFEKQNVDNVGLRPTWVYGPGRLRGAGVFTVELINKPAMGLPGMVPYVDAPPMDFMHVEDVARAFVLATKVRRTKTRNFTLAQDSLHSIEEIAKMVKDVLPEAKITFIEPKKLYNDPPFKFDASRAREELGFIPKYTMEDGVRSTISAIQGMNDASKI